MSPRQKIKKTRTKTSTLSRVRLFKTKRAVANRRLKVHYTNPPVRNYRRSRKNPSVRHSRKQRK